MLSILIVIAFGLLNGMLARRKGYPYWVGAISGIGIFLGTLFFIFIPPNQKNGNVFNPQTISVKRKKEDNSFLNKKIPIGWAFACIVAVILLATLPFHYLPDHVMVFSKEHFTFSNTFVFQSDVDQLIYRYNNASFMERQVMNKEPLVRKLMEKGIIKEIRPYENSDNYRQTDNYSSKNEEFSNSYNKDEYSNIHLTAVELYADYENNAVSADRKYRNKVIQVTGEVREVVSNSYEGNYVRLVGYRVYGVVGDCIDFYFPDRSIDEISRINKGQTVTIQGKCAEKTEYGSIKLKNCSIVLNQNEKEKSNNREVEIYSDFEESSDDWEY
jgi:hypothetical protein